MQLGILVTRYFYRYFAATTLEKAWSTINNAKFNPMFGEDLSFLFKFSLGGSEWGFAEVGLLEGLPG
jgi:hypothetical protein